MADTPDPATHRAPGQRQPEGRFRLGDWLVLPQEGVLHRGSHLERLEPRAMEVLVRLCAAGGDVVSAETLLTEIWRGTFYGDNPVHKAVAQIRKVLGDTAGARRYIETVRKRGYRTLVPVRMESAHGAFAPPSSPPWSTGSPFRGLRPFEAAQAGVFFGREAMVARSLEALSRQRATGAAFVLIVGSSGSGKTSLVQAGILPALRRGCDGLRACASARMRPGDALPTALADALRTWSFDGREVFHATEREQLEHAIGHQPDWLLQRIDAAFERALPALRQPGVTPCLVLILDPLEALLGEGVHAEPLAAFETAVEALAQHPNVVVLAACRVDFYAALVARLPKLAALKGSAGHVDLPPLGAGELARCVRGPAHAAGLAFERDATSQEHLDDRLIEDAQRSPEMLPMLQHVLDRLFERRREDGTLTFAAYHDLGGLEGAIARHAETVIDHLDAEARAALADVLGRVSELCPDSGTVVGRSAPWSAISGQHAERLVDALVDARLFASDMAPEGRRFRVAHETLLRQWPRAVDWAARNREWLHLHERVRTAAQRWAADGRRPDMLWRSWRLAGDASRLRQQSPERLRPLERDFIADSWSSARRQRLLASLVVAVMAALAVASGVLAVREHGARAQAEARRSQAEHLLDFALGDLADKLRPIARLDILQSVAQQALTALTEPEAHLSGPGAVLQRVRALRTLAEVLLQQGDLAGGARALGEAMSLVQGVMDAPGLQREALYERGQLAYWRGLVEFRRKQLDGAAAYWQHYSDDTAALAALEPREPKWVLERSYAMNNLGTADKARGRWADAIASFQASIALKRAYVALAPTEPAARTDLADSLSWLADTLERAGRPRDALPLMVEQHRLLQASLSDAPLEGLVVHQAALASLRLGLLLGALGDTAAAIPQLRESRARLQALALQDPGNLTWQRDAANAQLQLGWILATSGRLDEGRMHVARARTALHALTAIDRPPAEWRRLAAVADLRAVRLAQPAVAIPELVAIVERLRALLAAAPADADTRAVLASALLAEGDAHAAARDNPRARALWREAIALVRAGANPDAPDRTVVESMASSLARLSDPDEARWVTALADAGFAHPAFEQDMSTIHASPSHPRRTDRCPRPLQPPPIPTHPETSSTSRCSSTSSRAEATRAADSTSTVSIRT